MQQIDNEAPTSSPVQFSAQLDQLATALAKAQADLKPALKDSENPHFRSKFADLASVWDAIRVPFTKNGLSITQHASADGAKVTVTTFLLHASGQWMRSDLTLTAVKVDPQAAGSAVTYARRYALAAVCGVVADVDDDANAATFNQTAAPAKVGLGGLKK